MSTTSTELDDNPQTNNIKSPINTEKPIYNPELIRALTPITIAVIGGIIGVSAIFSSIEDNNKLTAAMGLAGTALAGASGLAQSNKNE